MRIASLFITLLFITVPQVRAQETRISTTEPIISSYTTIYEGTVRVIIQLKFREESDVARSVPLGELQQSLSMKATASPSPEAEPDKLVQPEAKAPDDKTPVFRFLIDVGHITNTFSLAKDWISFRYRVSYRYTKDGEVKESKSSIIPVDRRIEEIKLTPRWGTAVWFNEPSKDKIIRIPVTVGPPIGVKLSLFRKGDNRSILATSEDITAKNELKEIELKTTNIIISEGDQFTVKIEPVGLPITLDEKEATHDFTIQPSFSYEINETSLKFLKSKLQVTSLTKPFSFTVTTTTPGSLKMSFNGGEPRAPKSASQNDSVFELTTDELRKLDDGNYRVSFSGNQTQSTKVLTGRIPFRLR